MGPGKEPVRIQGELRVVMMSCPTSTGPLLPLAFLLMGNLSLCSVATLQLMTNMARYWVLYREWRWQSRHTTLGENEMVGVRWWDG